MRLGESFRDFWLEKTGGFYMATYYDAIWLYILGKMIFSDMMLYSAIYGSIIKEVS